MTERKDSDWLPFRVLAGDGKPPATRGLATPEGRGDRLRTAAFAELQAREAFLWAAERFGDAPPPLRDAWRGLAGEEDRHLGWLLARMRELAVEPGERPVSLRLWRALRACASGREFATLIGRAEERGRLAGERFCRDMARYDAPSAEIFGRIADEEVAHVELARRFYPDEDIV